jgi:hypothetical protein
MLKIDGMEDWYTAEVQMGCWQISSTNMCVPFDEENARIQGETECK